MRWFLVLALAACAAPETQAEADRNFQRRMAAAAALGSISDGFYQAAQAPRPVTTNCTPGYGGSFSCRSY